MKWNTREKIQQKFNKNWRTISVTRNRCDSFFHFINIHTKKSQKKKKKKKERPMSWLNFFENNNNPFHKKQDEKRGEKKNPWKSTKIKPPNQLSREHKFHDDHQWKHLLSSLLKFSKNSIFLSFFSPNTHKKKGRTKNRE